VAHGTADGSVGVSEEESRSIIRAIDEAVSNIMRHSYRGRFDRHRSLVQEPPSPFQWERRPGVEFLLFDRGPAVDPTKLAGRR